VGELAAQMSNATPELVELSTAERESIERSAITIVENIPRDQRGKILDAMERTYLKLARKYGKADGKGRPWGVAMARTLRTLVAEIEHRQFVQKTARGIAGQ